MKRIDSLQLVSAVAESYLASLRQRGVKAASLASHMRALQTMVGPFGDLPLASLAPGFIQQAMALTKSPEEARRLLQAWKAFFAWAREQGYEAADPASGLIPQSPGRPLAATPYNSEEVRQILSPTWRIRGGRKAQVLENQRPNFLGLHYRTTFARRLGGSDFRRRLGW